MPTNNARKAVTRVWRHMRKDTAQYGKIPVKATREDELAAMERYIAERGVTRLPEVVPEDERQMSKPPAPMPGMK